MTPTEDSFHIPTKSPLLPPKNIFCALECGSSGVFSGRRKFPTDFFVLCPTKVVWHVDSHGDSLWKTLQFSSREDAKMYEFLKIVMFGCKCSCGMEIGPDHVLSAGVVRSCTPAKIPNPMGKVEVVGVASCPRCTRAVLSAGMVPKDAVLAAVAYECDAAPPVPSEGTPGKLPDWVVDAYKRLRCAHCCRNFEAFDVVGLQFEAVLSTEGKPELQFHVLTRCEKCEIVHSLPADVRLEDFLSGSEALARLRTAPHPAAGTGTSKRPPLITPSRRPSHLVTPISESEAKSFLAKLQKLSWKRGSKAFKQWAQLMGFDVDAPMAPNEGDDDGGIPF